MSKVGIIGYRTMGKAVTRMFEGKVDLYRYDSDPMCGYNDKLISDNE